jgi:hypothetical protein
VSRAEDAEKGFGSTMIAFHRLTTATNISHSSMQHNTSSLSRIAYAQALILVCNPFLFSETTTYSHVDYP